MTTYIPTSDTSKIAELNVRFDGSGWLVYPSGSTHEVSARQVGDMLAGAGWKASPLNDCPARIHARVTGSVGATWSEGDGPAHVYDRKTASCTVCAPTAEQESAAAAELVRGLAFELASATARLAANPSDIDNVDAVLKIANDLQRTVYGA